MDINIPLTVPKPAREAYTSNYRKAVKTELGRLMLFAGDQKIEHLNKDFYGSDIDPQNNNPEHLFKIASKSKIGVFATQLGLLAQYGSDYTNIDYLVKVNSKTDLVKTEQKDPLSTPLCSIEDIIQLKNESGLSIVGVGYTVYLGSEFEHIMISHAARLVTEAHKNGLITVLWMYPRGKAVADEKDAHLIAGAAGVAACLGADFAKIIPPKPTATLSSAQLLAEAAGSAGRTGVICSGGSNEDSKLFLQELYDQIHTGSARGSATGRNIHQKPLDEAIRFANAVSAITLDDKTVDAAIEIAGI